MNPDHYQNNCHFYQYHFWPSNKFVFPQLGWFCQVNPAIWLVRISHRRFKVLDALDVLHDHWLGNAKIKNCLRKQKRHRFKKHHYLFSAIHFSFVFHCATNSLGHDIFHFSILWLLDLNCHTENMIVVNTDGENQN